MRAYQLDFTTPLFVGPGMGMAANRPVIETKVHDDVLGGGNLLRFGSEQVAADTVNLADLMGDEVAGQINKMQRLVDDHAAGNFIQKIEWLILFAMQDNRGIITHAPDVKHSSLKQLAGFPDDVLVAQHESNACQEVMLADHGDRSSSYFQVFGGRFLDEHWDAALGTSLNRLETNILRCEEKH